MHNSAAIFKENFTIDKMLINELMSRHTTFKVGGPAAVLFTPFSVTDLLLSLKLCKENQIPYYIMGNGSNLLFSDEGYEGVVIQITKKMAEVTLNHNSMTAESGISLASLAKNALNNELSGLEFASGIPGSLGGAIYMNAGAYGGEMKDIVKSVKVIDELGAIRKLQSEDLKFDYRYSVFHQTGDIIIEATMEFVPGNYQDIEKRMLEFNRQRREKQPVNQPSAGSTFKRPKGHFAGKLIMDSGLRGFSIGGALVSDLHCGFIVNKGNASAKDIMDLIAHVQNTVYDKFAVQLEPEVRIIK